MSTQVSGSDKVLTPGRKDGETRILDTEALAEKVEEVRERARGMVQRSKERALELEHEFEGYVRQHPVKSVAIAAGVGTVLGVVIGVLVARR